MRAKTGSAPRAEPNPEALGLLERFGAQMLVTARRYSASPHDAEDAYQRAAEILLTHRPTGTGSFLRVGYEFGHQIGLSGGGARRGDSQDSSELA